MDKLSFYRNEFLFFFIIIIGFLLRIFNLNYDGLWNDELFTAFTANPQNDLSRIIGFLEDDIHPPLHNILCKYWAMLFSYNDLSLKVFSVVVGLSALVSVYKLANLIFNERVALFSLALASVNFYLISYSQEVRAYMLLFLITNYTYYYFIKLMNNELKWKVILMYSILMSLLLYTHYFGVFILVSQFVTMVVLKKFADIKNNLLKYFLAFLIPFISFSFWIPILLKHLNRKVIPWREEVSWNIFFEFLIEFFNDKILALISVGCILMVVVFLVFRRLILSNNKFLFLEEYKNELLILIFWILITFTLPLIKSIVSSSMMVPKYFIIIISPILFLGSFFLSQITNKKTAWNILIAIMVYSFLLLFLKPEPYYMLRNTYRETVLEANTLSEEKPPVLFLSSRERNFKYYLLQHKYFKNSPSLKKFKELVEKNNPEEYFVMIDLKFYTKRIEEINNKNLYIIDGYKIIKNEKFKNMYNQNMTSLVYFKKTGI